jgi:transcriptional regulator with XRE-family HTH domain
MAREPLLRRLVGAILRARREAQGRTLRDVAVEARVSVAYLSEIERGRKEASSEVLVAVCGALGMGLVDLLAEAHRTLVGHAQVLDLTAGAPSRTGGTLHVLGTARPPGPVTSAPAQALLRAA